MRRIIIAITSLYEILRENFAWRCGLDWSWRMLNEVDGSWDSSIALSAVSAAQLARHFPQHGNGCEENWWFTAASYSSGFLIWGELHLVKYRYVEICLVPLPHPSPLRTQPIGWRTGRVQQRSSKFATHNKQYAAPNKQIPADWQRTYLGNGSFSFWRTHQPGENMCWQALLHVLAVTGIFLLIGNLMVRIIICFTSLHEILREDFDGSWRLIRFGTLRFQLFGRFAHCYPSSHGSQLFLFKLCSWGPKGPRWGTDEEMMARMIRMNSVCSSTPTPGAGPHDPFERYLNGNRDSQFSWSATPRDKSTRQILTRR